MSFLVYSLVTFAEKIGAETTRIDAYSKKTFFQDNCICHACFS